MKYQKKANFDEIAMLIATFLSVFFVSVWYLAVIDSQNIQTQNFYFENLQTFKANYEVILSVEEAEIKSVKIFSEEGAKLSLSGDLICHSKEGVMEICDFITSSNPLRLEKNFTLDEINYFNFSKKAGVIAIEQQ